jgi:hypothetical protein
MGRAGQAEQPGARAVQFVAPRSMSAWFHSPDRPAGTSAPASRQRRRLHAADFAGPRTRKTRDKTRATFVSTVPTSAPKAMLATAAAV